MNISKNKKEVRNKGQMQKVPSFDKDWSNHSARLPSSLPSYLYYSIIIPPFCFLLHLSIPPPQTMRIRLVPITLLLFHLWSISLSDTVTMEACAPVRCGSVNISYPFWVRDKQPDYCGYPTLDVDCHDEKPFLVQSYDTNYYIDRVFYDNSSFILINSILVNWTLNCSVPEFNVSITLGPLVVSKTNKELVFFYDCDQMASPPVDSVPVTCGNAQSSNMGNNSFVRLFENYNNSAIGVPGESLINKCSISRIPVLGWNGSTEGMDQYTTLMSDGFLVELKVTSCSDCQKSGGQCGFNNTNIMFMCICPDGNMHPMSCPNSGGNLSPPVF